MGKGQAWSIDLVIGVLIFLLVIGLFYVLLINNFDKDTTELQISSETIATKIIEDKPAEFGGVGIIQGDRIDEVSIKRLLNMDYEDLKREFGINNEFCIFLEDENGNVINMTNGTHTFVGIGSGTGDLNVSGSPCGLGSPIS